MELTRQLAKDNSIFYISIPDKNYQFKTTPSVFPPYRFIFTGKAGRREGVVYSDVTNNGGKASKTVKNR